jgi:hypothetical protein
MVFSLLGVGVVERLVWLLSSFSAIAEVEGEREKVFARGPRWVSFNSMHRKVSMGHAHGKG